MYVRLAFAVMIQVDAEVLLIDEVLAVGDAAFQQKCYREFERMRDEGRTILFVTHDMEAVNRFCHRALLLERGRVIDDGRAGRGDAASTWRSTSAGSAAPTPPSVAGKLRRPRRRDHRGMVRGRARASDGSTWRTGRPCTCKVRVEFNWELRGSESSSWRSRPTSGHEGVRDLEQLGRPRRPAASGPATQVVFSVGVRRTSLAPGRYYVSPAVVAARRARCRRRRPPRPCGRVRRDGRDVEAGSLVEPAARLHASSALTGGECRA